jgi:hypothetical protein
MKFIKNKILCTIFCIISVMSFGSEISVESYKPESSSISSLVKNYFFLKIRSFGFKVFYNYLDSMIVEYKKNHLVNYKVGMQHISARYLFQDINQLYDGQTVLHQAMISKNYDAMKMLLFFGADSQVANSQGITSLDIAHRYQEDCYVAVCNEYIQLHKKRIKLDSQSLYQSYYVKVMHKLIALQGIDKKGLQFIVDSLDEYKNKNSFLTHIFLYVIDGKCIDDFINISDVDVTLLQQSIYDNNIDLAQILLYLGADPMLKNSYGLSAFELAIKNKNIQFLKLFWPYISCNELRSEIYPLIVLYKDELLECVREQGNTPFIQVVYHYFGMQYQDELDSMPGTIVDFWN